MYPDIWHNLQGLMNFTYQITFPPDMGWGTFKPLLTEVTISSLKPIQTQYQELMNEKSELLGILEAGREKAEEVAKTTLEKIQSALGLLRRES